MIGIVCAVLAAFFTGGLVGMWLEDRAWKEDAAEKATRASANYSTLCEKYSLFFGPPPPPPAHLHSVEYVHQATEELYEFRAARYRSP